MARPPSRSKELAAQISVFLKRFEADKNGCNKIPTEGPQKGLRAYYNAGAYAAGGRVFVIYISYQGPSSLTVDEASAYLAWLEAGGVGRHFDQQKAETVSARFPSVSRAPTGE